MRLFDPTSGKLVWDSADPYAGPVPPPPEGRAWVKDMGAPLRGPEKQPAPQGIEYYLGGTGIPERLGVLNKTLNPVEAIGNSMQASQRMFSPNRTGWERVADTGDMLSGVAGVVGPAAVASKLGAPAASALQEAFVGLSMSPQAKSAKAFMADEFGGMSVPFRVGNAMEERGAMVLDLIKSGRAAEVTDEMLDLGDAAKNARLNEFISTNYDLPLDTSSRMARARGMYEDAAQRARSDEYAAHVGLRTDTKPDGWTRPSRVWDDGKITRKRLPGVSVTEIGKHRNNDAAFAAHGLGGEKSYAMEDYVGGMGAGRDYLSLIFGDTASAGQDLLENVIPDAQSALTRNRVTARFDPRLAHLKNLSATVAGGTALPIMMGDSRERRQ